MGKGSASIKAKGKEVGVEEGFRSFGEVSILKVGENVRAYPEGENLLVEGDEDDVDEVGNIPREEGRSHLNLFGDTGNKRVSGIYVPFSCPEQRVQSFVGKIPASKKLLLKRKEMAKNKKVKCKVRVQPVDYSVERDHRLIPSTDYGEGKDKNPHKGSRIEEENLSTIKGLSFVSSSMEMVFEIPRLGPCLEAQAVLIHGVEDLLSLKEVSSTVPFCNKAQSSAMGSLSKNPFVDSISPQINLNSPGRQGRPKRKGNSRKRLPNSLYKMALMSNQRKSKKIKKKSSKVKSHPLDVISGGASSHVDPAISNSISDSHVRKVNNLLLSKGISQSRMLWDIGEN
ncbi:hypothetical protein TanjilG_22360 [Lupinus angustifolius]|uniref:Uncharacterized protein n=1 Tax=Lupinus angustifolius TaxID=3871 RepID=A0A1J7HI87_LUPAN|nr:hypothetical protein TanjilG_22360 [Lupinus angustifolius]